VLPKKSTHALTDAYTDFHGYTGLPVITSRITIQGNGARIVRKKGDNTPVFRLIAVSNSGDLTFQHVTLSGGVTDVSGGGIYNRGTLNIENCTISGNKADFGGGIYNAQPSTVTIENSTISGNSAGSAGGGMYNDRAYVAVENSTISSNSAGVAGGGMFNFGARVTVENSTISGNTVIGSVPFLASGGGIFSISGTLTIENSTISDNTARDYFFAVGGGVYNDGTATIENSTISGNTVRSDSSPTYGGGVYNIGTLTLNRSLISGNNATTGPEVANDDIVYADNFNLLGSNGNPGVTGFTPGPSDIVPNEKLNKIIGPLKNNGGPTKTHALVSGSPAIDAAPADADCPPTDQRSVARPRGLGCDIGAFEK
jgi:hypothetical protein